MPDRKLRITFHTVFGAGVLLLGVLVVAGMIWSVIRYNPPDWLSEGRYVELTADRYGPGAFEHFAFDEWDPPRPLGFFLLRGPDGAFLALSDRPGGCVMQWRSDRSELVDPCRGTAIPADRLWTNPPSYFVMLPVDHQEDVLRVDLRPLLGFR